MPEREEPMPQPQPPEEGKEMAWTPAALNAGEQLIVIGGVLLFGVSFFLFDLILEEYFNFTLAWLGALAALVAVWFRLRSPQAAWPVSYRTVLLILGWMAIILQADNLIGDLRAGLDGAAEVLGALSAYAGGVLILIGVLQLPRTT